MGSWIKLPCKISELRLDFCLVGGQCFRWKHIGDGAYRGVVQGVVLTLKQDLDNIYYIVHNKNTQQHGSATINTKKKRKMKANDSVSDTPSPSRNPDGVRALLQEYFNLSYDLSSMYQRWSGLDANFAAVSAKFPGVRILCQDPVENLISFICSSNNNITRISQMVERMCAMYGEPLAEVDGVTYHHFPSLERLAYKTVETDLREAGFGYRAKFIQRSAEGVLERAGKENLSGREWLLAFRQKPYKDVHRELTSLCGIGSKVADCVCLMSLHQLTDAIPVDTHVWQLTVRDYLPHLAGTRTMTGRVYREVGDFYRERFGQHAGWANSVLFSSDLKKFKESDAKKRKKK